MRDDTLVIWGGEFGPHAAVELPAGRERSRIKAAITITGLHTWLAGGGVKGARLRATDRRLPGHRAERCMSTIASDDSCGCSVSIMNASRTAMRAAIFG